MSLLLTVFIFTTLLDPPPLNINNASQSELICLDGIGPATASAIIQYRETVSSFLTVEELLLVPGVGQSTLEDIYPYIVAESGNVSQSVDHYLPDAQPSDTLLTVGFLDVGNGDAILLQTSSQTWLVDAGPPGEGAMRAPVIHRMLQCGVDSLTAVIFTHPHADHIGGCQDVLELFGCRWLIDPGLNHGSPVYENLLEFALTNEVTYQMAELDKTWDLGSSVTMKVVWLQRDCISVNEASAVYLVECGDFALLITGDIENETILEMTMDQQAVTVMKVPHHGSRSSLFPPWIRNSMPQIAVITCGRANPFGHPHIEVVEAWREAGASVLRTDLNGNIFLYTDGESISYTLAHSL